jgi:serine/threonine-protein kinase HipA
LELALSVAPYFEVEPKEASMTIRQVGEVVSRWRNEAKSLGLPKREIDRMASAFEHDDLKQALQK